MDIRESEEFKLKQREMIQKQAQQEISASNILAVLHQTNALKDKVYAEHTIGSQGFLGALVIFTAAVSAISLTSYFQNAYPRVSRIFGSNYLGRVVVVYLSMNLGRSIEQYYIEKILNREAYDEYAKLHSYYMTLKNKKVASLPWYYKMELLLGYKRKESEDVSPFVMYSNW